MSLDSRLWTSQTASLTLKELIEKLWDAKESEEVRNLYLKDISSSFGKALDKLLDIRSYVKKTPDHSTYLDLPDSIVAATVIISDGTVILAYNQKYADKLRNNSLFRLYVNLHEHTHVRGETSESYTGGLIGDAARYARSLLAFAPNKMEEVFQSIKIEVLARYRQLLQYEHKLFGGITTTSPQSPHTLST